MKKIILFIFALMLFMCSSVYAASNSIKSVDMKIYINENGDASVTERWTCNVKTGTESYHPYYNLGNSEIKNLTVKDEDGVAYETLNSWNVNSDFANKKYKCGINRISNGVELCWGISEFGNKVYTVNYDITNFVSNLNDAQMVYWTLIPYDFSTAIQNVEIEIYSDFKYEDTLDVWGYGNYGGLCYVSDGTIKMSSDGVLNTDEYMTILVKFPQNTFKATNNIEENFEHYLEMAEMGSVKYIEKGVSIFEIIIGIVSMLFPFIMVFLVFVVISKSSKTNNISKNDKKLVKDAEYYRDIPCNSNLFLAYFLSNNYGILSNKTNIIGAIFLKWLKEKRVVIEKRTVGFIKKREEDTIVLKTKVYDITKCYGMSEKEKIIEEKLYSMVYKASGDGVLEKKELEKWCSSNYDNVYKLIDDINKYMRDDMISAGNVTEEKGKGLFSGKKYTYNEKMLEEAVNISGLRKYLKDYTLIHDRQAIEVELFENYLIFAQMLRNSF